MTNPTNVEPSKGENLRQHAYSALYCLNLAVEPDIAKDVYDKVHAYIESLRHSDSAPVAQEASAQSEKNRTPDRRAPGFTADDAIVPVVEGVSQPETVGAREWRENNGYKTRYSLLNPADRECSPEVADNFHLTPEEFDAALEAYAAESSRIRKGGVNGK